MASSMGPAKIITDGLIMHFDAANTKSYPGSGTTTTDLSITAITASLVNGPTFSTDGGGSFLLDGANDYINISQNSPYQFTNTQPYTINSWVKCTNTTGAPTILTYALYSGNYRGYYFGLDIDLLRSGSFVFDYYDGTTFRGIQGVTGSITTGSWVNLVGTSDGNNVNNMKVYQNGILTSYTVRSSGSPATINYTGVPMRIGVRETEGITFFKGNIAQVQIYNRALSANEVFQNYEATRERFNRPTIVTDDDARNFLNSANISSETQQRAVNDLVVDLKNTGLWGKMKAIYPFVGGTAASHKWNLKDPRDVDAAFRLQFNGGWTHSSNGADPNGTTAYADTFLTPSSTLLQNSTHISFYSRENSTGTEVEMGVSNSITQANRLFIEINTSGTTYISVNDTFSTTYVSFADTDARGYYIGTRTSSNSKTAFRNNIAKGTSNAVSDGLANWSIYIGAYHSYTGTPIQYYSTKQCAFATIGDGLTDSDASNLYTIVQKYQTTLGRQV